MAEVEQNSICFLRQESAAYRSEFANFQCTFVPVLRFEFNNIPELQNTELFSAIVVTSPRGVQSLTVKSIPIPIICLGPATAKLAKEFDAEVITFTKSKSSATLASLLIEWYKNQDATKTLLLCLGNRHRPELPNLLREAEVSFTIAISYNTLPVDNFSFPDNITSNTWIVFFSPSGVDVAKSYIKETYRLACLGNTTGGHMREVGLIPSAVAIKPTAQALREAIESWEND